MRFIIDECTGPAVAKRLSRDGHDVVSVFQEMRGANDNEILSRAFIEKRILVTNDRDFGEMVFREQRNHHGIILLRLDDERPSSKISCLINLIESYNQRLQNAFVVVTDNQVRFAEIMDNKNSEHDPNE